MRVAIVTDVLPPVTDGVTRTMSELASTLRERGIPFLFVSAVSPGSDVPWRDCVHVVPSMPLFFYPAYRVGLPFGRAAADALDAFAPDVVHVVSPSLLSLWAVRYARRRGVPCVGSFHTDFASCLAFYGLAGLEALTWKLLRALYNQLAVTFAPSRHVAARLGTGGVANVELWRRGVDLAKFSPLLRDDALRRRAGAADAPLLLFVGRLCREKNLPFLVAAVRELERRGCRFRLALVGDGPLRAELEALLPNAFFAGVVHGLELARWYASADLFVFPSTVETFGNVVLEAFASGLPVAALDAGGVREVVRHGVDGGLFAPDDPVAFAEAVATLLAQPEELARLSANARASAEGQRWSDVNGVLLEHYDRHARAARDGTARVSARPPAPRPASLA